jgi:hypothetical protein
MLLRHRLQIVFQMALKFFPVGKQQRLIEISLDKALRTDCQDFAQVPTVIHADAGQLSLIE